MRAATAGRRLVAAVAGAGIVVAAGPALAAPRDDSEAAALVLLTDAAEASRTLAYSGTQYVAAWSPADTTTALVEVQHTPGHGAQVRTTPDDDADPVVMASGPLDPQLVDVLARRYSLRLVGEGRCTGRSAQVVEARRPGVSGTAAVAGRFWVDRETGLLLRREVFDGAGNRLRSNAFLDLTVTPPPATPARVPFLLRAATAPQEARNGKPVPPARLDRLRADGLVAPEELPGGYALFDAASRDHGGAEVLHLAYSDGLSTTSLFSQPGRLGSAPPDGFTAATLAGEPVWWSAAAPQRAVWSGGGRVWTLVSDAPHDDVEAAVAVLPHEALPDVDTGWRARLARGLTRLGGALNPFS